MEDSAFTPNTMLGILSDTCIDFNLMDQLLFDGLETTDGSNFWQPGPTTSNNLNSPSFYFPASETNINSFNTNPYQDSFLNKTEEGKPNYFGELSLNNQQMDEFSENPLKTHQPAVPFSFNQSENIEKQLWIGPNKNPTLKKKLVQAINHLKNSMKDKDVLIQIWVPVKREGKQILTTNNQPFSLNPNSKNLAEYRNVSRSFQFAADENSKDFIGLPGRVFLKKLPEWTPDVRFFRKDEYPRVIHAQQFDIRGSFALPVFEQGSGNCLGVVEIITTNQKVSYLPELEKVCSALEAVHLKSSTALSPPNVERYYLHHERNQSYHAAQTEIMYVLKCVCNTHNLPLAQTWVPCIQHGKKGCHHSNENYTHCISTLDSACYMTDPQVSGFHEACSEHHLLKGEGIAGKAFLTNQPCFSEDITVFCKTEYPLAHHARVFNLCAAVAIRLRCTYTETADYVLEFFLPVNCKDGESQMVMLDSLSSVIQQTCQSLRVVTDNELPLEISVKETDVIRLEDGKNQNLTTYPSKEPDSLSWVDFRKDKGVAFCVKQHKNEPEEDFKVMTQWNKSTRRNFSFTSGSLSDSIGGKSSEKRRVKMDKTISLQVLRQYFAGSLKDAAKNIGVCPTTLKRICRQHGISRWPSRKIKKVGHSLKKLQVVIDSVQGAQGSIQLSSFYNNFPELVSPNKPKKSSHLPISNPSSHFQGVKKAQDENTLFSPATTSSSSGSHSSSSSYCLSTEVKQSSLPVNGSGSAELQNLGQEEMKILVWSNSCKILSQNASTKTPSVPRNSSKARDVGNFRVKATFGEEKIRLSLQPQWDFEELRKQVLRRFNLDTGSRIDLKYLDDDSEWVLLTCDADLEECIDIHRFSKSRTIKILLKRAHHPSLGSSFGSNCPF